MKPATFLALMPLLPSVCSSIAISDTEPQPLILPAATYWYELEQFEDTEGANVTDALVKRTNVKICEYIGAAANCINIINVIKGMVQELAGAIKRQSDKHDCSTVHGTAGNGKVKYIYHGDGRHCDTTAQAKTIAGAIEHHLKHKSNGNLCHTECLDLTHGGTWDGYLLIGPAKHFESDMYCGPHLPFKNCDSGGKGDLR